MCVHSKMLTRLLLVRPKWSARLYLTPHKLTRRKTSVIRSLLRVG